MLMDRKVLAEFITERISAILPQLQEEWKTSRPFGNVIIDNLLPPELARQLNSLLPDASLLMLRQSAKERKRVGVQLEKYAPEVGEILFAFQDEKVIAFLNLITGFETLQPDPSLYGSGISEMLEGDFLLPHLDNSHDGDSKMYRVLNALYYITPDWPENAGGNLELWNNAITDKLEIHARFNRLVLMETHTDSIHSVSKVTLSNGRRSCVSNYYFSPVPVTSRPYIHRTTFFARPEDGILKKIKLAAEGKLKNFFGKVLKNNTGSNRHRRH